MKKFDSRGRLYSGEYVYTRTENPAVVLDTALGVGVLLSSVRGLGVPESEIEPAREAVAQSVSEPDAEPEPIDDIYDNDPNDPTPP